MAANKLSDAKIKRLSAPGIYADGAGLYLQVTRGKAGDARRSWFVRLRLPEGRSRDMGLGTFELVPLADARTKALAARVEAKAGRDPLAAREAEKLQAKVEAARALTFRQAAEAYIAAHRDRWRSAKHANQWSVTLATYAYPVFGDFQVAVIDKRDVLAVLEPIWAAKPETASRLRGRIEAVLDWAAERGYRAEGDNPARRDRLKHSLPSRAALAKAKPRGNHAALPFTDAPAFWRELAQREGVAPRALAFAILTAARTGEVIGADWREMDLVNAVWTLGADRMKGGREHRVPLSKPAVALLRELGPKEAGPVFAGPNGALSNMALLQTLRRMGRADVTAHGFRSTFRDWAAERTAFAREVAEAALAHAIGDKVEAAYRRGDLFDKRRRLMGAWAGYLETPTAKSSVVGLRVKQST
ncbi:tyrosine-type recombinase/integrase [Candidatus Viadribacter manganicus]|uniref:Integrase n=1 Tax=Candidatus Viadribacter manganicus TaxID=1759059 RepID=A0A1B1AD31_9PROT|nr:site-specific integrase [Candidatus Viadribacter manganicus]ANP44461.1 integrase [Candidatus Viadribacter manganicus]